MYRLLFILIFIKLYAQTNICIKYKENTIGMKRFSKLQIIGATSAKKTVLKNMLKEIFICMLATLRKKQKLGPDSRLAKIAEKDNL